MFVIKSNNSAHEKKPTLSIRDFLNKKITILRRELTLNYKSRFRILQKTISFVLRLHCHPNEMEEV